MLPHISETGLKLLAYLHEHSGGRGQRTGLDPKPVAKGLRIGPDQFASDSSALAGYDLAGVRRFRPDASDPAAGKLSAVWLTGRGEDFLRRLAADPGVGRRVTVDVVMQMGAALPAIANKVLADFLSHPR